MIINEHATTLCLRAIDTFYSVSKSFPMPPPRSLFKYNTTLNLHLLVYFERPKTLHHLPYSVIETGTIFGCTVVGKNLPKTTGRRAPLLLKSGQKSEDIATLLNCS